MQYLASFRLLFRAVGTTSASGVSQEVTHTTLIIPPHLKDFIIIIENYFRRGGTINGYYIKA